jgi:hypothetical protein
MDELLRLRIKSSRLSCVRTNLPRCFLQTPPAINPTLPDTLHTFSMGIACQVHCTLHPTCENRWQMILDEKNATQQITSSSSSSSLLGKTGVSTSARVHVEYDNFANPLAPVIARNLVHRGYWMATVLVSAFRRANHRHIFQDSILNLVPEIVKITLPQEFSGVWPIPNTQYLGRLACSTLVDAIAEAVDAAQSPHVSSAAGQPTKKHRGGK